MSFLIFEYVLRGSQNCLDPERILRIRSSQPGLYRGTRSHRHSGLYRSRARIHALTRRPGRRTPWEPCNQNARGCVLSLDRIAPSLTAWKDEGGSYSHAVTALQPPEREWESSSRPWLSGSPLESGQISLWNASLSITFPSCFADRASGRGGEQPPRGSPKSTKASMRRAEVWAQLGSRKLHVHKRAAGQRRLITEGC